MIRSYIIELQHKYYCKNSEKQSWSVAALSNVCCFWIKLKLLKNTLFKDFSQKFSDFSGLYISDIFTDSDRKQHVPPHLQC